MNETQASVENQIWDRSLIPKDHQCLLEVYKAQLPVSSQIQSNLYSQIQTSFEILIIEKVQISIVEVNTEHRAMVSYYLVS